MNPTRSLLLKRAAAKVEMWERAAKWLAYANGGGAGYRLHVTWEVGANWEGYHPLSERMSALLDEQFQDLLAMTLKSLERAANDALAEAGCAGLDF
jgi:hypothetical protein